MRTFLTILFCFLAGYILAQVKGNPAKINLSKYTGKYEVNGMIVQVGLINKALVLVVPGAPFQEMISSGINKFKTDAFSDETFLFVEKNGKIEKLISQRGGSSVELKKLSDTIDNFNEGDSLMELRRSTAHFQFLYSKTDSARIDPIADSLEVNYHRILADLKVEKMPVTTVRIYPDLTSFHQGINFPGAPDNVLATAFGKNDFRMVSPGNAGTDSLMLMKGVAHEFTHCVHLNIDYSPNNPRWLWEGIAMFESGWFFDPREIDLIKNKTYPQLASLNNGMEYMLGYVIIEAIKDTWSFDTVINLIRKRGNAEAVLKINENQFEEKIFDYIYKKYIKE
jgi:hypothetical protein